MTKDRILLRVIQAVVPAEPYFVFDFTTSDPFLGVLSFWLIAEVDFGGDDVGGDTAIDMWPIVADNGLSLFEQIQPDSDNWTVVHWSEMRKGSFSMNIPSHIIDMVDLRWEFLKLAAARSGRHE